jgi:coenzyme F420-0:L-glutamate ligase / coenzyme F420-1:gamma-L-glutamate ligase
MSAARTSRPPIDSSAIELFGLRTLPEVKPGDDLAGLISDALHRENRELRSGDVLVVAQKVVSKAEGSIVRLSKVKPSELARSWARTLREDSRFIEVVLRESRRVIRMTERALIVETRHGFICANAGVDRSNVRDAGTVTCLPPDPDRSALRLSQRLRKLTKARVAVIISDTFGRPWRLGLTNVAIGAAGLAVLEDLRGTRDASGRKLQGTILAVADELAAAAGLAMKKAAQVPAVIIRGFSFVPARDAARQLIRPASEDMFR